MSKFIRNIEIREQVGEETAVFNCRPMTRVEAFQAAKIVENEADLPKLVDMFVESIATVSGLTDAAGAPITKEDLAAAFFLQPLIKAAGKWTTESSPKN